MRYGAEELITNDPQNPGFIHPQKLHPSKICTYRPFPHVAELLRILRKLLRW